MTVSQWLRDTERRLEAVGIDEARLESSVLLGHALGVDRAWLLTHHDAEVPALTAEPILIRRLRREPLAYILGYREFYGRRFQVGPAVLIPRQETECVVEATLGTVAPGETLLDLGAGSGCIGITVALENPGVRVTLADVSPQALAVTQANAEILGAKVETILSDGFRAFNGRCFDVIVSNPPYIAEGAVLMPEVGLFEPELALYAGETGFGFYERLAHEARAFLNPGGRILLECGDGQAEDVQAIFRSEGWHEAGVWRDLLGIDRAACFR